MTPVFGLVSTTGMWSAVGLHLFLTAGVAVFGLLVRYDHAKKSTKNGFIGWVVYALALGGFFLAGVGELFLTVFSSYSSALAWLGFLVGLFAGNLLGRVMWWYSHRERKRDEDTP